MPVLRLPEPYDFDLSTERYLSFGPVLPQVRQVGAEREVPLRGEVEVVGLREPQDRHLYMANASARKSVSFANGTSRSPSQRARFPVAKTLSAASAAQRSEWLSPA